MQTKDDTPIYIGIVIISILIFSLDFLTKAGYAGWVFYLVPVALSALQRHKYLPFVVGTLQTIMIAIGLLVSPTGVAEIIAVTNRCFGVVCIFGVAFLAYRVVTERLRSQHLLWMQNGQSEISQSMLGEQRLETLGNGLLRAMATYLNAQVAVLYRVDGNILRKTGAFAITSSIPDIPLGHGMIGEVAQSGKAMAISDIPDDYLQYGSATGQSRPHHLIIAPITAEGRMVGIIEIGFAHASPLLTDELALINSISEGIGVGIRSALYRQHLQELLEETQRQSEELQAQQEELRVSNEELEEQSKILMKSQAHLENQQAELEQTNVQLEEQAERLESQKRQLIQTQHTLEVNAEELGRANRYKSEFLANMSHELRTPLNSSLILSQILIQNKSGTLTEEQIRYAQTIHASNNDLLALINDILDLSKIEAGHADIHPEPMSVASILEPLRQSFEPLAKQKGLSLVLGISSDTPQTIVSDSQRLQQVLKNLLSNALKFTERGEIVLHVAPGANDRIAFAVRDTGIGIPEHQQEIIFEAFRQADGTTSRKYGGTGLGLSISRELAHLLGGEIRIQSAAGLGSTFTLEIATDIHSVVQTQEAPLATVTHALPAVPTSVPAAVSQNHSAPAHEAPAATAPAPSDDRLQRKRERLILAVEDDPRFAAILYELVHELDFDCVLASNGTEALRLARELHPNGILLDVGLPDQSGLSVLEKMKRDPATRHIPIHMISVDDHQQTALELGAVGYAFKPVARDELMAAVAKLEEKLKMRARRVLVVEDDATLRENIALLLKADDIDITTVGTVAEALEQVSTSTFDCMVMDLVLPDASGYDLLEKISSGGKYSFPPVIVYTGGTLTRDEEHRLRRYSQSIIIKGAKSPERLLDEVTLFLHRVEALMPLDQQKLLRQARQRDTAFEGKRILLAEDDVRNIFALSSILEPLGATLEIARNGKEALQALDRDVDIDLILMDLMMPEMDGLTAMREIRKRPELTRLPIIALTANAMENDRQNCLDAGANDYIAKPIDVDRLVSLCRVWMPK